MASNDVERVKAEGNKMFTAGKFAAAAVAYGDALMCLPSPPPYDRLSVASVLHSNRAMCYKQLSNWDMVEQDAKRAIDYDRFNAKGHYLLGLCLCRRSAWAEGVSTLTKAREMAVRQKRPPALINEFESAIAAARYEWHAASVEAEYRADETLKAILLDALHARRERDEAKLKAAQRIDSHAIGANATSHMEVDTTTASSGNMVISSPQPSAGNGTPPPPSSPSMSPKKLSTPVFPPVMRRYSSLVLSPMEETSAGPAAPEKDATVDAGSGASVVQLAAGSLASDTRAGQLSRQNSLAAGDVIMAGPGESSTLVQSLLSKAQAVIRSSSFEPGQSVPTPQPPVVVSVDVGSETAGASAAPTSTGSVELPQSVVRALDDDHVHYCACIEQLFSERDALRRSRDIPEAYICGITLDLMLDPVITPYGHSYERAALEQYLKTAKSEDPRTRKPLRIAQLISNLALKESIAGWLRDHPWAHPRLPYDAATGKVSTTAAESEPSA